MLATVDSYFLYSNGRCNTPYHRWFTHNFKQDCEINFQTLMFMGPCIIRIF